MLNVVCIITDGHCHVASAGGGAAAAPATASFADVRPLQLAVRQRGAFVADWSPWKPIGK